MYRQIEIRATSEQIDDIVESLGEEGLSIVLRDDLGLPHAPNRSGFTPEDLKTGLEVLIVVIKAAEAMEKLIAAVRKNSQELELEVLAEDNLRAKYQVVSRNTPEGKVRDMFIG